MPRKAMLAKVNEAWKLRAEGKKHREIVAFVGVQERQIGNYLRPDWVLRQKDFLELSRTELAELTPSLQKVHPKYEKYREQLRQEEAPDRRLFTPFQEQAYDMHQHGDHSWLTDSSLDGHVFKTETVDTPDCRDVWIVPPGVVYYEKPDHAEARLERLPRRKQVSKCPWCQCQMETELDPVDEAPLDAVARMLGGGPKWKESRGPSI